MESSHTHLEKWSDDVAWMSFHWLLRVKKKQASGKAMLECPTQLQCLPIRANLPLDSSRLHGFGSLGFRENVYQESERGLDRQTGTECFGCCDTKRLIEACPPRLLIRP